MRNLVVEVFLNESHLTARRISDLGEQLGGGAGRWPHTTEQTERLGGGPQKRTSKALLRFGEFMENQVR